MAELSIKEASKITSSTIEKRIHYWKKSLLYGIRTVLKI